MSEITVKRVETEQDMEAAVGIRFRVFVDEQSVPPEIELDEYDAVATHAIALLDGAAIGTGRAIVEGNSARIGRMAVDRAHRRGGVGELILRFLEDEARAQGATEFVLHAQEYVKSFYAATATPNTAIRSWKPAYCTSRCGRGRKSNEPEK